MISATFTKLRSGDWGIRIPRTAEPGDPVQIVKRDGTVTPAFVGTIVARFDDGVLATIERDADRARDLAVAAQAKKLERARSTVAEERARELSRQTDATVELAPMPAGVELYPYQRAGVAYAVERFAAGQAGVIIGDEMGLGKTPTAIATADAIAAGKILIVCPASLVAMWERAIGTFSVRGAITIVNGTPRNAGYTRWTIMNYEKVAGRSERAQTTRDALMSQPWDLIVYDEAHYIKNGDSQRTRFFLGEYARGARLARGLQTTRALYLTGTPVPNKTRDLLTLLRACGALPADKHGRPSEWQFLSRYCGPQEVWTGRRRVQTFDGSSHLDELQAHMRGTCLVRRLKSAVLTELPPKVRTVVPFDLAKPIDPEIDALAFDDYDPGKIGAKVGFDRLAGYRAELGAAKVSHAIAYVRDLLETQRKVIVFAHHKAVVEALHHEFGDMAMRIDGSVPQGDRQALVDRFQTEHACRVAILSTHAAGVGLTLTAADQVVFVEADWSPSWCVQAEDRAHRIGQRGTVCVHYLTVRDSLDDRVLVTMKRKLDLADRALDRTDAGATMEGRA